MNRIRKSDIAAAITALAVVAGLVFALRPESTPAVAVEPAAAHIQRLQVATETHPMMLFIGDSYVAGTGLDETSYGCMAAARMRWNCRVAAGPGTGYISGGPANRFNLDYIGESTSFGERIAGLKWMYQPNVVVLDGGRNDQLAPAEDVYQAILSTIGAVRTAWPAATVLVLRPRFLSRPDDDLGFNDEFFDRLESDEATEQMVLVADPLATLARTDTAGMVADDDIHPNRKGELAMATALFDTLITLGFTPEP